MTASPPPTKAATVPVSPTAPPPAPPSEPTKAATVPVSPTAPPPAPPSAGDEDGDRFSSDEAAAFEFVEAVERAVAALQSIRSRLSRTRDATAATGHMLDALLTAGGSLRDYDRSQIWAMRHALGGEGFAFASEFDAAASVLATIVHGLRPTSSPEEEARKQTARAEIDAIALRLTKCDHAIESTRALDQWERGMVAAKAASDKTAHEARLARSARAAQPPPPKPAPPPAKAGTKRPVPQSAPEGDYPLPGSVEAGADPFPTNKVG